MNIASLIYFGLWAVFFTGLLAIAFERNRLELEKIKRWRYKIEAVDLKRLFILKPYYGFLNRNFKEKAEIEIWESISFMRNVVSNGEGGHYTSDALLEEFIKRKEVLAPAFTGALQLMRQNQMDEAFKYFTDLVATKNSKEFAHLLIRWDIIDPDYLMETLVTYQKNIREARFTAQKQRDETLSNLIYLPAVLNIMLILLNFIYVGYFKEQMEMLTMVI